MKKPPENKLGENTLAAVEQLYRDGIEILDIVERTGVSKSSVIRYAKAGNWPRPGKVAKEAASDIEAQIEADTFLKVSGVRSVSDEQGISDASDARAAIIRTHRVELASLSELRILAMRAANDKTFKPDGWDEQEWGWKDEGELTTGKKTGVLIKVVKPFTMKERMKFALHVARLLRELVAATGEKHEYERRAHGFDYKMQMEERGAERDALKEVEEFNELMASLAERLAAPTPEVPKRRNGETIQ